MMAKEAGALERDADARAGLRPAPRIAVLVPCLNEETTIRDVVSRFRKELPEADIYVFDNNSCDRTVEEARRAGASVFHERRQGKGHVIQAMFREVDADIYVIADGDGQCPAGAVHELIAPILDGDADMVVASRLHGRSHSQFKPLNLAGNKAFLLILNSIFKVHLTDVLSGYRAFTRRFVKDTPLFGGGFEIEAELTIKALARGYRVVEVPVTSGPRAPGTHSKVRLVRDGMIILNTILALFRDYRPLTFFGALGLAAMGLALVPGLDVVVQFVRTGRVLAVPSAVLAVGLVLAGMLSIAAGLVIHTVLRRFQEFDHYLQVLTSEVRAARAPSIPRRRAGPSSTGWLGS